jgi:hypothetical protein
MEGLNAVSWRAQRDFERHLWAARFARHEGQRGMLVARFCGFSG